MQLIRLLVEDGSLLSKEPYISKLSDLEIIDLITKSCESILT